MPEPTKADLLACVERELRMRRRVYAHRVADGKMTQAKADHEIACMEAIARLLEPLAQAEKPGDLFSLAKATSEFGVGVPRPRR